MKKEEEKPIIVKKVSMPDTFKAINPGAYARFSCIELGPIASAYVAISRLNQEAGWKEFACSTKDNGASYTVTRFITPNNQNPNSPRKS